jgi:Na+/melibiose symporter-like transporter
MFAALVIQGLALPMVHYFGQGDSAKGYKMTMAIFSSLAVLFFIVTFLSTRERIHPPASQKASVREHFRDLAGNRPWLAMFALTVILLFAIAMRGSVVVYYFKYYVGREDLFSWFTVSGILANIIGIFFCKSSSLRYGKRNVFIGGLCGTTVFTALFVFLPPAAIPWMFATEILRQFVYGFTIPLLWVMMADVADYSEWKNHRRATGLVFSAIVFGLKAGLGFGGAISGYLLSVFGYVPNAAQPASALTGIRLTMSIFPALTFGLCVVCLLFYSISKETELQMTDELAARRRDLESPGGRPVSSAAADSSL